MSSQDHQRVSPSSVQMSQCLKPFVPKSLAGDGPQASALQVAPSQQPSPEMLASLGIKVRDFAYGNTLPAIVPVPRVPRQVQPAPRARTRPHSDDTCASGASPGGSGTKRPRSLERRPTEPLQETLVQRPRTLQRITISRVCSIIIPSPRSPLPATPHARFPASPPTSPLVPPLSIASATSQLVHAPVFPFVVHVDDTGVIPASRIDPESQPTSFRPALLSKCSLNPHSSRHYSPTPSPRSASPPLSGPYLELPSPSKEPEADTHVRKRRNRGVAGTAPAPSRYQLRQRPTPSPASQRSRQASSTSSKSLARRTHRMR